MLIALDFETYYDDNYSLTKMDPWSYVADRRFTPLAFAFTTIDADGKADPPAVVLGEPAIRACLDRLPWSRITAVAHNAVFDGLVLARLGHRPKRWLCTQQLAHQTIYPETGSVSLDAIVRWAGLQGDIVGFDKSFIHRMLGRSLNSLTAEERAQLQRYVGADTAAVARLLPEFVPYGEDETKLVSWTIEQSIYPRLAVDTALLEETSARAEEELEQECARLGVTRSVIASKPKFAALLAAYGVDVPLKDGKLGLQPALARSDGFLDELAEEADPTIAALARLRLRVTSTIERTRAARMAAIAKACGGRMPVPLHWHKARTGRWTGAARLNMQNLSRGSGPLRRAIRAPDGQALVVVDAAQIEARILATLAGATSIIEAFAARRDVYAEMATQLYGYPVTKATHPRERQIGKLAVLSLGYGCGAAKFRLIAKVQGGIDLDEDEARRIVTLYRRTCPQIPALWAFFDTFLLRAHAVSAFSVMLPRCPSVVLRWEAPYLWLPSGRPIVYRLEANPATEQFVIQTPLRNTMVRKPIWGGYVTENIVQAFARDVLCAVHRRFLPHIVHQVHDELVALAPEANAQELCNDIIEALRHPPVTWLRSCPFDAEGTVAKSYGEAK
jgi:DNA polymerase